MAPLHCGRGVSDSRTASYPWPRQGGRSSSFPACLEQGLCPCDGQGTWGPRYHAGSAPAGLGQGLLPSIWSECPGDGYAAAEGFGRCGEEGETCIPFWSVSLMSWWFSDNLETLSLFMGAAVGKSAAESLDPEAGNVCCSVLF